MYIWEISQYGDICHTSGQVKLFKTLFMKHCLQWLKMYFNGVLKLVAGAEALSSLATSFSSKKGQSRSVLGWGWWSKMSILNPSRSRFFTSLSWMSTTAEINFLTDLNGSFSVIRWTASTAEDFHLFLEIKKWLGRQSFKSDL